MKVVHVGEDGRPATRAEVRWALQDLRERFVLAQAARVRAERRIREVVTEPRNHPAGGRSRIRLEDFADPGKAVARLRQRWYARYLICPERANRISPGFLIRQYDAVVGEEKRLAEELGELEAAAGNQSGHRR